MRKIYPKRSWVRLLALSLFGALALVIANSPAALADTPTPTPSPNAPGSSSRLVTACKTVVKRVSPTDASTEVVSRTCGQIPESQARTQKQLTADSSVLLVTLYEDINESGYYDDIYGQDGPCDALGYSLSDLYYSNAAIGGASAYVTYNDCSGQRYYHDENFVNYCGTNTGYYNDWVGSYCNDHLLSMKVYKFY